jgi:hypothetical protein
MCRGPLAYGHATATRIHCGVRFGEAFLRIDRGLGHLTEDVFVQRVPRGEHGTSSPTRHSEPAQGEPDEREGEEPGPRTILTARSSAFAGTVFTRVRVGGRPGARRSRGRGAPNGRLLHRQRARPPLPQGPRRREGTFWPCNRNACALRRPGAARGSRRQPPRRAGPRGSRSRRSNRRRTHDPRPRRRDDPRRRLGLLHDGSGRLRRRRSGTGRRIGAASRADRQERQRVEVPVRLGGQPNSEVDRRHAPFPGAELGFGDHVSLRDRGARAHGEGAEMEKSDGVPVLGPERDRPPAAGHRSRECDHARDWREHVLCRCGRELDPAVLPGRVRVAVDMERPQHRAGHRPAPGRRGGGHGERPDNRREGRPARRPVVSAENHAATVSGPSAVVKIVYSEPR